MAAVAIRIVSRTTTSGRNVTARVISLSRPLKTGSSFRIADQKPLSLSARIFRSPVEMSCVAVQSMLPYHSATASSLLTSMLSVTPRSYGWTLEGTDFESGVVMGESCGLLPMYLEFVVERRVGTPKSMYSSKFEVLFRETIATTVGNILE